MKNRPAGKAFPGREDGLQDTLCLYFVGPTTLIHPGILEISVTEKKATNDPCTEQSVLENAQRYQAIFENALDGILVADVDNKRFLDANATLCRMLGYKHQEILKLSVPDIHPKEHLKFVIGEFEKQAKLEIPLAENIPMLRKNGSVFYADISSAPFTLGSNTYLVGVIRDITERKRAEAMLRRSAAVLENTTEGIIITDEMSRIVDINHAFTDITGYQRDEVIGCNPSILSSGRHDKSFYRDMWHSVAKTGQWRGEIWNRHKDGSIFPEWLNISSVLDDEGNIIHYAGVFSDISRIKRSQDKLDHLAHHDALTDLPNRLLLNERLDQSINRAIRHSSRLAIIFLDLDRFKHINDSLGHPAGDQLLQEVAKRLVKTVRNEDTVARVGGDEFLLLLEDIRKSENVVITAEKLISIFERPFQIENQEVSTTASLGISLFPSDGKDPQTLLRNADAAMYKAKGEGRNTYHFYTEKLTTNAFEHLLLETELRRALDREQLVLHYQAQINLQTQDIIGVEALIRWQHPELGTVFPSKFIHIAEETGLIHPIGEWVLQTACHQAKAWLDQGIDFGRIAVNIAGPQIQRKNLTDVIVAALAESGLPAAHLELEISEGYIMQQDSSAITQLDEIIALGVTLAIDDFGTGYFSLSQLKHLPIHKLKLDQAFVRDIPEDMDDMAISAAVVALGKSLRLTVCTEGVETEEQASFLKKAGCQEAQGFLYGMPTAAKEFEKQLRPV